MTGRKTEMTGAQFLGWCLLGLALATALAFCCGYNTP